MVVPSSGEFDVTARARCRCADRSPPAEREEDMATYVLVHGAWHSGDMLEDLAGHIRKQGHTVHCPTLAGNRPGDSKQTGLDEAIGSLVQFFKEREISDAILVGHSFGGMAITG